MHDDDDLRAPLRKITGPACVRGTARSRTRKRRETPGKGDRPREIAGHTRLVAEPYIRLAEIEENLEDLGV